jgi:type I restriction enzyme S subunit
MWPAGSLCITIAANIAKTAILGFDACFPDSVVGFMPGEMIDTHYTHQWFVTRQAKIEELAPQAAQKNINLAILNSLSIPVPPLPLQKEFAVRVAKIRSVEAKQAESSAGCTPVTVASPCVPRRSLTMANQRHVHMEPLGGQRE